MDRLGQVKNAEEDAFDRNSKENVRFCEASSHSRQQALVYLGDFFAVCERPSKHLEHVQSFLTLLGDTVDNLNLKTYEHFTSSMKYRVYGIWPRRLEIAFHTSGTTPDFKSPTTETNLKYFLGLPELFQRLVSTITGVTTPVDKRNPKRPTDIAWITDSRIDRGLWMHFEAS